MLIQRKSNRVSRRQMFIATVVSIGLSACVSIDTGGQKANNQQIPPKPDVVKNESNVSLEDAANFNMTLGAQYLKQNNLDQAISKLEKAVEQQPKLALAHTYLAFAYERYGEVEKAQAHYSRAVKLDSNDPISLNNYGTFLCRQNKVRESLKFFEKAVSNKRYQTPGAALVNAGVCAKKIPDYAAADTYFRRALQVNPKMTDAYYHLTDVNLHTNKAVVAQEFFNQYQILLPTEKQSAEYYYLGYRLNKALNNLGEAGQFALKLQQKFPTSLQTKKLLEGRN